MDSFSPTSPYAERPPYRPPIGIPARGEPRAQATIAAILLHALVILLVLAPTLFITAQIADIKPLGAGGRGPAGGGGGGNGGVAGALKPLQETLRYMRLSAPEVPVKSPDLAKPKPEEKKPPVPEPTRPDPVPAPEAKPATDTDSASSVVNAGKGAGTGADGTSGNGPGSGGGVGSGVGPGRGSGNGPGTGGGDDTVYPPTVVAMPIMPLPVPSKVRPYQMTAEFDVDSLGNAKLVTFNPSRDAGYNRRVKEALLEIRFRPATRMDGRPIRALAVVTASLP